jgi:hypothetical protein
MKNIKKIADEIFKAPTEYDLLQRKKMSKAELDLWMKENFTYNKELYEKLLKIFYDGVFIIDEIKNKEFFSMIAEEFKFLPKSKLGIMRYRETEEGAAPLSEWVNVIEGKYGNVSIVSIGSGLDKMFLLSSNSPFVLAL